jgi:hypothetical protein
MQRRSLVSEGATTKKMRPPTEAAFNYFWSAMQLLLHQTASSSFALCQNNDRPPTEAALFGPGALLCELVPSFDSKQFAGAPHFSIATAGPTYSITSSAMVTPQISREFAGRPKKCRPIAS